MSSSGPRAPGTLEDSSGYGTNTWSNPSNAGSSNNAYATGMLFLNMDSHYLKATNFGFAIPSGATINGIVVEIEKKTDTGSDTTDKRVRIVKGGTVGSTDKSSGSAWGTSDATATYGGSSDLWGESWTHSDINSSTFGVVIAAGTSAAMMRTASIDNIQITVHYTLGATYTLTATAGPFVQTGNAASLLASRKVTGVAGSLAVSGNSAGLLASRRLTCVSGSFAMTGAAANLSVPSGDDGDASADVSSGTSVSVGIGL